MAILQTIMNEMAACGSTGAGSVATTPGSLFAGGTITQNKKKKKKGYMIRRVESVTAFPRLAESLGISTGETNFDPADVIAKLDAAEKQTDAGEDTASFGLEDENGNIIKVSVRSDQADNFEHALAAMLGEEDQNEDGSNSAEEIAEVLYQLKSKFDIVDVNWGEIGGDEEEEQDVEAGGEQMGQPGEELPPGEGGDMNAAQGMEPGAEMGGEDESAKSALQQVIDVLKANAEAQKAEAEARTAEAKAKEAEFMAKAAESKVKQEEEVLDMETYYKKQNEQKKEAKRIAQLAKYKHDMANDAESTLGSQSTPRFEGVEQEEKWEAGKTNVNDMEVAATSHEENEDRVMTPRELVTYLFRALQSN